MWSEIFSSQFKMLTKLFDCVVPPGRSPPMAGRAPNATGVGGCSAKAIEERGLPIQQCYETAYWPVRTCLGAKNEMRKGGEQRFETLETHLRGRGPLSTHVKMNLQGSEWSVLEQLIASDEDQHKIRTLDMEVNFGSKAGSEVEATNGLDIEGRVTREVRILEALLKKFWVTGTTLEVSRMGWMPASDCPTQQCREPVVHTVGGFTLERFDVSFVNKKLVNLDGGPAAAYAFAQPVQGLPMPSVVGAPVGGLDLRAPVPWPAVSCEYMKGNPQSSRPGRPCLPPANVWPYETRTPWKLELGERLLVAVTPAIGEGPCGGFELFGDQSWCRKALPSQSSQPGILGLSFGIEERDMWSETFSNQFKTPTKVFDCFIPLEKSPPMSGTAPNATGHAGCEGKAREDRHLSFSHCYETAYWPVRACLGSNSETLEGRTYETLDTHLRGRQPLSAHVKIDVDGSEWSVLERLIASDEDMDKIRTLDMEVHFGFRAGSERRAVEGLDAQGRIQREVKLMEGLLRKFWVTGTTLEVHRMGWTPETDCPKQTCRQPWVHTAGGFSLEQFAISYVNKRLVEFDGK